MTSQDDSAAGDGPRTLLHIGTMKSGTSYLQDVLDRNRAALAHAGVAYRGRGTRAVWDVLGLREAQGANVQGAWSRLAAQTARSDAPTRVLSMEMLSTAKPDEVRTIVSSIAGVEVIITARDLGRQISSAWQNIVKHGSTKTFDAFVRAILDDQRNDTTRRFWRQHDVAAIVERWAEAVGPERVHLVTVPPSGAPSTLLWERFCVVLGVDPSAYDAGARQTSNVSLSYSDAELLRKINKRLNDVLTPAAYNRYVRTFLANEIMRPDAVPEGSASPPGAREAPTLGLAAHAWAVDRAEEAVAALSTSGIHVVGDLQELVPKPYRGDPDAGPGSAPLVVYPDAAMRVLVQLLRKLSEVDPELQEAPAEPAMVPPPHLRAGSKRRRGAARRATGTGR